MLSRIAACLLIAFGSALLCPGADGRYGIESIAGVSPDLGDGGPATSAFLRSATAVAIDGAGNLYVADSASNMVRRISSSGEIRTVAGTGVPGYAGDGGPATQALLSSPSGVAVDQAGNIYISDRYNYVIRKVTPDGAIRTVAGTGQQGASGEGVSGTVATFSDPRGLAVDSSGNLYIADFGNSVVRKLTPAGILTTVAGNYYAAYGGDGGPATQAYLNTPQALAVDASGNLYISDVGNNLIRKVSTDGTITTVAGNGTAAFAGDGGTATAASISTAGGLAVDAQANLYIADTGNDRVRRVTPNGIINTVAGSSSYGFGGDGGPATAALLNLPSGVAVRPTGELIIADDSNGRLRRVDATGTIDTIAGRDPAGLPQSGPALTAYLDYPNGLAVGPGDTVYVADADNQRVVAISPGGALTTIAGDGRSGFDGDGGPALAAAFWYPLATAFDSSGNLYIVDSGNSRVRRVASDGTVTTVAGSGNYQYSGDGGSATSAGIDPIDIAFDTQGNLYIADRYNSRVRRVTPGGSIATVAGNGTFGFSGDGGRATAATMDAAAVAVDGSGNLYIADYSHSRVRMVTPGGIISTVAGNGNWQITATSGTATALSLSPTALATDSSGNVFIADASNDCIWKLTPGGTLAVVAGLGTDATGEAIPATAARLHTPIGVAAGSNGDLYVVESGSHRVRKLTFDSAAACAYAVDQGAIRVPAALSTGRFTVTAGAGCAWSAASDSTWLGVTSGGSGIGSGTVQFAFAANTGAERVGRINVGGQSVTVTQVASNSTVPLFAAGSPAVNGASFLSGISSGAWVTISGTNLATISTARIWRADEIVDGKLPPSLEGVSVTIDGKPASMYYVGPSQLNVQAPDLDHEGEVDVEVTTPTGKVTGKAQVKTLAPAFFISVYASTGLNYVAAVQAIPDADNIPTYIVWPSLLTGVRARTAKPGDLISLYGTGFGPTDPARPAGEVIAAAPLVNRVRVFIGEQEAEVSYSGLVGPGLNQINIRVPDVGNGEYLIRAEVGGVSTQASVFLTVQQ